MKLSPCLSLSLAALTVASCATPAGLAPPTAGQPGASAAPDRIAASLAPASAGASVAPTAPAGEVAPGAPSDPIASAPAPSPTPRRSSGGKKGAAAPVSGPLFGGTGPNPSLVEAALMVGTRATMSAIQAYDRNEERQAEIAAAAAISPFRLLQAEGGGGDTVDTTGADFASATGSGTSDGKLGGFLSAASDVEVTSGPISFRQLNTDDDAYMAYFQDMWNEWSYWRNIYTDGMSDEDKQLTLDIEIWSLKNVMMVTANRVMGLDLIVSKNAYTNETGTLKYQENLKTDGSLSSGVIQYVPDAAATALGIPGSTTVYDVQGDLALTYKSGAERHETLGNDAVAWTGTQGTVKVESRLEGGRAFSGTISTDEGVDIQLSGSQDAAGVGRLTIEGPGFVVFYPHVEDLGESIGYVLDKAPTDPTARFIGQAVNRRGNPVELTLLVDPILWTAFKDRAPEAAVTYLGAPTWVADDGLGLRTTDACFTRAAAGAGATVLRGELDVAFGGKGHAVSIAGLDAPFMGEAADVLRARDLVTGDERSLSYDQEGMAFTFGHGAARVTAEAEPDGTWMVGDRGGLDADAAAALLASAPALEGASKPALGGLYASLAAMPQAATRAPSPCNSKAGENKSAVAPGRDKLSRLLDGRPASLLRALIKRVSWRA